MKDLTITQSFATLALNALDTDRMSTAKRVSLRCIAAAAVLEIFEDRAAAPGNALLLSADDAALSRYQATVLRHLLPKTGGEQTCAALLPRVVRLRSPALRQIERDVVDSLLGVDGIEIIPSLLSCDMYEIEAGIEYHEYRSAPESYCGLAEALRAELLEDGALTDEAIIQLWLLRESGVLHDFFADEEIRLVGARMAQLYRTHPLGKMLMALDIHKFAELSLRRALELKKRALATDIGIGVNFMIPIFERSHAVFIDVQGLGAGAESRMDAICERLTLLGHRWELVREGRVPLVRIDNVLYECVPDGVTVGGQGFRVPVYGVRLRRYPMFL